MSGRVVFEVPTEKTTRGMRQELNGHGKSAIDAYAQGHDSMVVATKEADPNKEEGGEGENTHQSASSCDHSDDDDKEGEEARRRK